MNEFTDYWIRQPFEAREAAKFGTFPLNQPELPIEWEGPFKPLKAAETIVSLVLEPLDQE